VSELLVVGAGPAGLTVAWRAAANGHDVRVVDAAPSIGGMAASIEVGGQRVDYGSHRLHPSTPTHLLAALRALLGSDLQERPRNGRLHLRERWIGFPLRTSELVRRLPLGFAASAMSDALTKPIRRPREDSFAEVVRVGLGATMLRDFYGPYATKLWGSPPDELAGELARRRIAASTPTAMVRKLVRGVNPARRTFLYPRLGYGQIVERVAEAAIDAGVRIDLATGAERLEPCADRVRVLLSQGECVDADRVVWTAPLTGLVRAAPSAPADVTAAVRAMRHRAMVLVYLVLVQPRYTAFDAHYVPDAALAMTRVSEPKNYRDGPDPVDHTVLCVEVPCTIGDDWWNVATDVAAERLTDDLVRIGLPRPIVEHVEVRRLPSVYPVYERGTTEAFAVVDSWASGLAGVTVLGRQGLFVADNLHHVMDMGWTAADALHADGTIDADAWSSARRRFARFVVED
jgi:protoporphyrinogen oxidase